MLAAGARRDSSMVQTRFRRWQPDKAARQFCLQKGQSRRSFVVSMLTRAVRFA
jgi:hypothetical protein